MVAKGADDAILAPNVAFGGVCIWRESGVRKSVLFFCICQESGFSCSGVFSHLIYL
jgi:hypothetical protein